MSGELDRIGDVVRDLGIEDVARDLNKISRELYKLVAGCNILGLSGLAGKIDGIARATESCGERIVTLLNVTKK